MIAIKSRGTSHYQPTFIPPRPLYFIQPCVPTPPADTLDLTVAIMGPLSSDFLLWHQSSLCVLVFSRHDLGQEIIAMQHVPATVRTL